MGDNLICRHSDVCNRTQLYSAYCRLPFLLFTIFFSIYRIVILYKNRISGNVIKIHSCILIWAISTTSLIKLSLLGISSKYMSFSKSNTLNITTSTQLGPPTSFPGYGPTSMSVQEPPSPLCSSSVLTTGNLLDNSGSRISSTSSERYLPPRTTPNSLAT